VVPAVPAVTLADGFPVLTPGTEHAYLKGPERSIYAPGMAAADREAFVRGDFDLDRRPSVRQPGAAVRAIRPVPVPQAQAEANVAVMAKVRDRLNRSIAADLADKRARYALAEIVFAAARHARPPYGPYCPDCKAADSGWCEPCIRADLKSTGLYRLHDLILAADTYAAAVILLARMDHPAALERLDAEGRM
jgi:hypothetical protein